MTIIDITQTYEIGMNKYPSIEDFSFEWVRHYDKGSGMAFSKIHIPSHLGTHIDSPFHFLEDGRKTIDIPLDTLCGDVQVVDARNNKSITLEFLKKIEINSKRLIFKTDNTPLNKIEEKDYENVYFEKEACEYLAEKGVLLIGIDYFSVDKKGDKNRSAHYPLLKNKIVILEGCVLDDVNDGVYKLYCLPLKIKEVEGVPVRAILEK